MGPLYRLGVMFGMLWSDCCAWLVGFAVATAVHRPDYDSRERLAIELHKALVFGMGFGDA